MANETQSVADILLALGGPKPVAALCGVGETAVINWRTWNAFPNRADVLLAIQTACQQRGVDLDTSLFSRTAA